MSLKYLNVSGLVLTAFCCGCGKGVPTSDTVRTVPAEGVLLFQGKPLAFHQVKAIPDKERPATAVTNAEGKFTLGTNRPGDGAVPGTHRVAVVYIGDPKDDPTTSGLITEFKPTPPPPVKIDKKYQKPETSQISIEIPPDGGKDIKIELK